MLKITEKFQNAKFKFGKTSLKFIVCTYSMESEVLKFGTTAQSLFYMSIGFCETSTITCYFNTV